MSEQGLVTVRSANDFDTTVALIEQVVEARELMLLGKIDHSAGARAANLALPPTLLLVFGAPKAGTPLMHANRMMGLDLPLKALVWEDDGAVWVTYREPHAAAYLHGLEGPDFPTLEGMSAVLSAMAAAVAVPAAPVARRPLSEAHARDSGPGVLRGQVKAGGQAFLADEPFENNGTEMGPSPHTLLSSGLAACTALTLRSYADRQGWPMQHASVTVTHERQADATPPDVFHRVVRVTGALDAAQTKRLLEIADRCPVHRTLVGSARVETRLGD
jgi:putative redox protein